MRKLVWLLLMTFSISLVTESCGTSKQSTRKCDGKKGQKTPMGRI